MNQFRRIVAFSQLEVIASLVLVLGLAFFIAFSVLNNNSYMQLYFDSLRGTSTFTNNYEAVSLQINSNEYIANGTIFALWSIVGLLLYYVVYFFFISEKNLEAFFQTLRTKGTDKVDLLEHAFARMAIRVGGLIGLIIVLIAFVTRVLPYIIANLDITALNPLFPEHGIDLLFVFILLLGSLHVAVLLLRCITLRVRVFF